MQQAIEEAIRSCWQRGGRYSYPMVYVKTILIDGDYNELEATPLAFSAAATKAFDQAIENAKPKLLEPIMHLIVTVPAEFFGAIVKDLGTRHSEVHNITEIAPGINEVDASVALSQMFGYSTVSRSLTQGRADYSMAPDKFSEVPAERLKNIVGD